jgi:hypothetical protein
MTRKHINGLIISQHLRLIYDRQLKQLKLKHDFTKTILLESELHPAESSSQRLLTSAKPNEQTIFLQELHLHYKAQNLYNRLNKLWQTTQDEWLEEHPTKYNNYNEQHIKGMLLAERKTCKKKQYNWSPKYSKAIELKAFWKIILALRQNHICPNHKLLTRANSLNIQDIHMIPGKQLKAELIRAAQRNL